MRAGRVGRLAVFLALLAMPAWASDEVPRVLTSIRPVHSIAASVMAGADISGTGAPELLLAGGASPHSYAMKPSDARKLAQAEIVFWIGPALEEFLVGPIRNLARNARVVALMTAPGMTLLPVRAGGLWEEEEGHEHAQADENPADVQDAHIWLDPMNGAAMARVMAENLAAADPHRAALYRANAERFAARMAELDNEIRERLAPVKDRPYIVFHDAFQYFDTRYGLSPQGSVAVAPDRPVGARRIVDLRARIRATPAICVFAPPQFPPRLIATLTEDSDAKTAALDELGTGLTPGTELYEALLRRLAAGFHNCLGE